MNSMTTVTVLFTDVVASTRLRTSRGDLPAHGALVAHEAVIREAIDRHEGREIKTIGDGFMVVFASARQAVACAVHVQRGLAAHRRNQPGDEVHVRIGIHTGDAIDEGDDVFGAAVDAATRIMSRAKGGEILISEMVRGVVGSSAELNVTERGRFALKGFETRWRLYEVPWQEKDAAISRRQLAIVVTDLTGSSAATNRLGDDGAFSLIRSHNAVIRAAASMHRAAIVKSLGDGFLLAFERPTDAVSCAASIQRTLASYRSEEPDEPLHVRVAVHAGRFIEEAGELFGKELIVVFRLGAKAAPDQVLVTDAVRSQLNGRMRLGPPMTFELDTGPQTAYALDWHKGRSCSRPTEDLVSTLHNVA